MSHPCKCGCGKMLEGRKLLAEGCKPAQRKPRPPRPKKHRTCQCGCGRSVTGNALFFPECREKRVQEQVAKSRKKAQREVLLAMQEMAEIKAASKPEPRKVMDEAERDALDKAKREADNAAEKELAARMEKLDPRLLIARRFVGVIAPYDTGFASPKVEYHPPQRAQTLAADRTAMWEG